MSTIVQRSFAYGELSPELRAKADLSAYSQGLKTARNVIVGKAGGLYSRPGTVNISRDQDIDGTCARFLGKVEYVHPLTSLGTTDYIMFMYCASC